MIDLTTNQSIDRPTGHGNAKLGSKRNEIELNLSINQLINHSIDRAFNRSLDHSSIYSNNR
jgi:hypothetical protein